MSAFGAAVDLIQSPSGQVTADLMPRMTEHTKDISQEGDCYLADQFNNYNLFSGYSQLGYKLLEHFCRGD